MFCVKKLDCSFVGQDHYAGAELNWIFLYPICSVDWSLGNQTRCADLLLIITKPSTTKWAYTDSSSWLTVLLCTQRGGRGGEVYFYTRWQTLFAFTINFPTICALHECHLWTLSRRVGCVCVKIRLLFLRSRSQGRINTLLNLYVFISSVPLISWQPKSLCWFTIVNNQTKYNKVGMYWQ